MPTHPPKISSDTLPIYAASFRAGEPVDPQALGFDAEWVLPDGLGGFAMGSIAGVGMRRYHGLLCVSRSPPVCRVMLLNALDEHLHIPGGGHCGCDLDVRLSGFQFADQDPLIEHPYLSKFTKSADSCHWLYSIPTQIGRVQVRKTLSIADRGGGCRVEYAIESGITSDDEITLEIRPLVSMRDFHQLNHPGTVQIDDFRDESTQASTTIARDGCAATLALCGIGLDWQDSPSVWRNLRYCHETDRGQDDAEDLYNPGVFVAKVASKATRTLSIEARASSETTDWNACSITKHARIRSAIDCALESAGNPSDPTLRDAIAKLAQASDDFIVKRNTSSPGAPTEPSSAPSGLELPPEAENPMEHGNAPSGHPDEDGKASTSVSILAGYPWFSDWGRDTMIALPGLMLTTGRFDEANQALHTFAGAIEHGLIPNRFDDAGGSSHYNTVDASLWFIHACWQWAQATGKSLDQPLIDACDAIIDAYIAGTINHIGLDEDDGLIFAGDANTQLTWMDALRNGVAFTPRHGKAIEINGLWINALEARSMMGSTRDDLRKRAVHARQSIINRMAQGPGGGLVDCITREHAVRHSRWISSDELRPNQIFALSLPMVNLPDAIQKRSLSAVADALLTPVGLRTLDPQNPNYCPHYTGSMTDRDRAYHNGTAWPWLLGPYCEAMLRVNNFDADSRTHAQAIMLGLVSKMESDAVGQLFEIYDAEPTDGRHLPQGCMAQAWSVSEALRVLVMSCRA